MILIDVFSRCNAVIIYVFHCNAVRRVEKKFRLSCFCVICGFLLVFICATNQRAVSQQQR